MGFLSRAFHGLQQVLHLDGLGEKRLRPLSHGLDRSLDSSLSAEHDDYGVPRLQLFQDCHPVDAREIQIAQRHIRSMELPLADALLTVGGAVNTVSMVFQDATDRTEHVGVIVDDQDGSVWGGNVDVAATDSAAAGPRRMTRNPSCVVHSRAGSESVIVSHHFSGRGARSRTCLEDKSRLGSRSSNVAGGRGVTFLGAVAS